MTTDHKIDTLPFPTKVMCFIPLLAGGFMVFSEQFILVLLGLVVLLLTLAGLTVQERVRVNFEQGIYRRYYRLYGILNLGRWKPLPAFEMITLTRATDTYRETLYSSVNTSERHPLLEFSVQTVNLYLKKDNRYKLLIAKGGYKKMKSMAHSISRFSRKNILDCTEPEQVLIKPSEELP